MCPRILVCLAIAVPSLGAANVSFDTWAESFAREWAGAHPQLATTTQYLDGAERDAADRDLGSTSVWGQSIGATRAKADAELARRGLQELAQFPADALTGDQRISASVIKWSLDAVVADELPASDRYVFEQFGGLHISLVTFLTTAHPIRNARDVDNYLARLALFAPRIDAGIADARAAATNGVIPPRFILERVLEQVDGFIAKPAANNPLVATLATRMETVRPALPASFQADALAKAKALVADAVDPAYRRLRAMLAEQLPHATDVAGEWRLPQGEEAYRRELARMTTLSLSPADVHAIGLREVARIEGEMDKLLRQLGYADGTVVDRYGRLTATLVPKGPGDVRAQLVQHAAEVVRDAEQRAHAVFDLMPRAPVEVRREPPLTEKTAAAHYTSAAPDGSVPGIFWLPVADISPNVLWIGAGLRTTAYHEAVPGHHFQIALQQEMTSLPRYRRLWLFGFNSAFAEGWGLYAERLADESGWYEGDPASRLGYLRAQLMRAQRLVVDTGLHAQHWTRQQAIDYGFTAAETERYIVWPGQACSYMIGQLHILEQREKAKAALGARFSMKEFHNVLLRGGCVPLPVFDQEVDAWIATEKSR